MIYLGDKEIKEIWIGTTQVNEVWISGNIVWAGNKIYTRTNSSGVCNVTVNQIIALVNAMSIIGYGSGKSNANVSFNDCG